VRRAGKFEYATVTVMAGCNLRNIDGGAENAGVKNARVEKYGKPKVPVI